MIEIKKVTKVHHNLNGSNVVALRGIDLKLDKTGLVFVTGKSGSGKTTLLNILSAHDTMSIGEMSVNGVDIKNFGDRGIDGYRTSFVGKVPQELDLIPNITLAENVALAAEIQGKLPDKAEISSLFKKLGIEKLETRYSKDISGGEAQRVGIARVLIKKPKVLIADEFTSGLDVENQNIVYEILKSLSKDILIITTTHNNDMAKKYGDRVITLDNGKIISDAVAELPKEPKPKGKKPTKKELQAQAQAEVIEAPPVEQKAELTFEQTRLPFKRALNIAWANFNANKLKTILAIVICILTISFFAVATNLSNLNHARLTFQSFSRSNAPYIGFVDNTRLLTGADRENSISGFYNTTALAHQFGPDVFSPLDVGIVTHTIHAPTRLVALDGGTGGNNIFGQSLLHGNWPNNTATGNEITISDFIATQIATARDVSLAAVVNTSLELWDGMITFQIVGIYRTNFTDFFATENGRFPSPALFNAANLLPRPGLNDARINQLNHLLQNNFVTAYVPASFVNILRNPPSGIVWSGIDEIRLGVAGNMSASNFFITDHITGGRPTSAQIAGGQAPLYQAIYLNDGLIIQPIPGLTAYVSSDLQTAASIIGNLSFTVSSITTTTLRSFSIGVSVDAGLGAGNILRVPMDIYTQLVDTLMLPTQELLVANNINRSEFLQIKESLGENVTMSYMDSYMIDNFFAGFNSVTTTMIIVAVILAMITLLLMVSFIFQNVRQKHKEIRTLRTLGAKRGDIIRIFIAEAALFTTAILLGVLLLTSITIAITGASIASAQGFTIRVFNTSFLFYFLVLAFTAITIFACYFAAATAASSLKGKNKDA
ncbi:MAG: ATP-binding cassette domain-containing protein [Firmicutes bacterium]|nr:ATP-binding cassette domain-containing protein [Bacillota bacterium]